MSLYASGIIRIISEPQLKTFDSGTMVCNFGGGIHEGKDKNGEYINNAIDVEAWGKTAEIIVDKLKKGDSIFVSGNLRMQEWQDRDSSTKRRKHVLSVQRFEFLPRSKTEEDVF